MVFSISCSTFFHSFHCMYNLIATCQSQISTCSCSSPIIRRDNWFPSATKGFSFDAHYTITSCQIFDLSEVYSNLLTISLVLKQKFSTHLLFYSVANRDVAPLQGIGSRAWRKEDWLSHQRRLPGQLTLLISDNCVNPTLSLYYL